MQNHSIPLAFVIFFLVSATVCLAQQPDPNSPRYKAAMAAREFFADENASVQDFAGKHLAPSLLSEKSKLGTLENLTKIKNLLKGLELRGLGREGEFAVKMEYSDAQGKSATLHFQLDDEPPHHFKQIAVDGGPSLVRQPNDNDQSPALTWENLSERMQQEAESGFAGAILIVRDGEMVLSRGYGFANQENQVKNTPETIFAIGSMPIDFTHASILQLVEQEKISLSDPITKFFDNVPEDKRAITIEHLRTGRSGLQDFHDISGVDANPDHSWIDRAEAIRRIMKQKLLFEPGKGRRHSHSAWGLLAAIVEISSGKSYQDYTRENLYEPAGMTDTGFFGEKFPENRIAVGYGRKSNDKVNSPDNWGPTSWLVMGSGGQVSTTIDMHRWMMALHDGKLLNEDSLKKYFRGGMGLAAAGDMFGFELMYTQRPETLFFLISNNVNGREDRRRFEKLGRDLATLVGGATGNKYSLGIRMDINESGVHITEVISGSAAERDGIRAGDTLISAGGKSLASDPLAVLQPYLDSGRTIEFEIERDGERQRVKVTPLKSAR